MTYAPTGGLVAAPTAALPEQVGGERNWDYRFTWVRDGSFSVYALLGLGFAEEAARVRQLAGRPDPGAGRQRRRSAEHHVPGRRLLRPERGDASTTGAGYRGSRPVRIGNGAAEQLQLDIYGEAMDAIYAGGRAGLPLTHQGWTAIASVLDWLADNWDQPDEGIWETRGGRRTSPTAG